MKIITATSTVFTLLALAGAADASPISSPADPALASSTLVDLEAETVGAYYAYQGGYTTLVGGVNFLGPRVFIDANPAYAGLYNTTGAKYMTNGSATRSFTITFPSDVTAFGFNFGASDVTWTATAYDAAGAVIETLSIPATRGSNAGDFFGIAAPGIASVTLAQAPGLRYVDLVFLDNLRFQ